MVPIENHAHSIHQLQLKASPARVFPLFGPFGERAWAGPDWDPRLIHSIAGEGTDVEGMIFRNGESEPVWVNVRFDPKAGIAEYIHFTPLLVTRIRVDVAPQGDASRAIVRYDWTAVTAEGCAVVAERAANAGSIASWEAAINTALSGVPPS